MHDLTVIFLTANRVPKQWASYHLSVLKDAIGESPVITISREPMDFGLNILQTEEISTFGIYWQMLKGVRLATTEYVAIAEDDTLYTRDHFSWRWSNGFSYNAHRWSLYTWNPVYSLKSFIRTTAVMIAPRALALEALEERFKKYPLGSPMPEGMRGELGVYDHKMGLKHYPVIDFKSHTPVVQFDHDYFTGSDKPGAVKRRHTKILATIQAYDIPVWGRADELAKKFV